MVPTSDPSEKIPSSVILKRDGRSPFRSRQAPTVMPSVNTSAAGPSHGSLKQRW